jgi:hypothetical protein
MTICELLVQMAVFHRDLVQGADQSFDVGLELGDLFGVRRSQFSQEIDSGQVARYGNGYEGYLAAKAADRQRRLLEYQQWGAEMDRSRDLITSNVARLDNIPRKLPFAAFGAGQFRMRGRGHGAMVRISNAKERVARLTEHPVTPPPEPLTFTAEITTDAAPAEETVARLTDVRVADRPGIDSLRLGPGERLLITGPNGAGKTTLLRVLSGELAPDRGSVEVSGRVGHLRQEQTPWPRGMTVLQAFSSGRVGDLGEHSEALLSLGLFSPDDLRQRVEDLSYGQRRRIELARGHRTGRPPAAGRTHQPPLTRTRRRTGGSADQLSGHGRRRHPRPAHEFPLQRRPPDAAKRTHRRVHHRLIAKAGNRGTAQGVRPSGRSGAAQKAPCGDQGRLGRSGFNRLADYRRPTWPGHHQHLPSSRIGRHRPSTRHTPRPSEPTRPEH